MVSIPDVLNIVSILTVLALAVIRPLALRNMLSGNTFRFPASARAAFAAGFVLLVCHPLSMVAHYGLLNKNGRDGFRKNDQDDYPYFPIQERVVAGFAILAALITAAYVAR